MTEEELNALIEKAREYYPDNDDMFIGYLEALDDIHQILFSEVKNETL